MNEPFTFQELETLIAHRGEPAVSIFLPTLRIPTRVQAESLQLKNLLRDAEEQLKQFDLRGPTIQAILEPARALISKPEFWRHQQDGLAVFHAEETHFFYQVPNTFDISLFVSEAFHVKPLIPILANDAAFYVLAVSQNKVRFLRCNRFAAQEIDPKSVPSSLQEILDEYELEKNVQYHTSSAAPGTGRRGAIFYGQGAGATEDEKVKIREYFGRINQGIHDYLRDQSAPLVFAGVEYLFPIYREANTYPNLVESSIAGNPDEVHADELHREAWNLIEPLFMAQQAADIEKYHNAAANGLTATNIEELLPWADQGRIETAFIDKRAVVWGIYDQAQFEAHGEEASTPRNRDLTDMLAIYTLLRKGTVYLLTPEEMAMEFGPANRHQPHHDRNQSMSSPTDAATPEVAATYRFAI